MRFHDIVEGITIALIFLGFLSCALAFMVAITGVS